MILPHVSLRGIRRFFRADYASAILLALHGLLGSAGAATAPTATGANAGSEAIALSPFEVVDARNDGYGANRSSSVTLLNQDIAMLPVTSEVITETFMRDLNLNGDMSALVENFGMSAGFASNQNPDAAFGSEPGSRQANAEIKLRGLGTGGIRRDGMIGLTGTSSSDAFSTERIEILRGPNALLYQDAGGGGIITAVSKQARFDTKASLSFSLRTDSFGSQRGEADFNQSFSTHRGARCQLPRGDSLLAGQCFPEGWRRLPAGGAATPAFDRAFLVRADARE
jgi:outer membrane receptor for monomeric catechols